MRLVLLGSLLLLSACGQAGALYLPSDPAAAPAPKPAAVPAQAPTDAEQKKKDAH
jgi:predicted small lipoprotein YifL